MARKLRCGGDVESSLVQINSRDDDFSFFDTKLFIDTLSNGSTI